MADGLARKPFGGRKPKSRGNRAEREVVDLLKQRGYPAYRNFASGGYGGADVIGLDGFSIEVKCVERLNIWAALEQSEAAASGSDTPAVFFRRNRSRWYVALPVEDLLGLLDQIRESERALDGVVAELRGLRATLDAGSDGGAMTDEPVVGHTYTDFGGRTLEVTAIGKNHRFGHEVQGKMDGKDYSCTIEMWREIWRDGPPPAAS